ncbi:Uncharacterised protein g11179 [Pycnogonum litorale]
MMNYPRFMKTCNKNKDKNTCIRKCVLELKTNGTEILKKRLQKINDKIMNKNITCKTSYKGLCKTKKFFSGFIRVINKYLMSQKMNRTGGV